LKPERWGSLLVQEKYQGEKDCDKRQYNDDDDDNKNNNDADDDDDDDDDRSDRNNFKITQTIPEQHTSIA
jgi:hypothetical protein